MSAPPFQTFDGTCVQLPLDELKKARTVTGAGFFVR